MADLFIQSILSNLLISSILAIIAWMVQRRGQSPVIANFLWMLVLVKMITPPIWSVELIPVNSVQVAKFEEPESDTIGNVANNPKAEPLNPRLKDDLTGSVVHLETGNHISDEEKPSEHAREHSRKTGLLPSWISIAGMIWAVGSLILAVLIVNRIWMFRQQLKRFGRCADSKLISLVNEVAKQIGLKKSPRVTIIPADVAPFCWWLGGRPEVVLSAAAVEKLDLTSLRMVIAHELAHLKRKDHWVRWLECVVCLFLWWNPVMWWARRHLRITEEMSCDALVIKKMNTSGHVYASSLLSMTELLASPAIRPPAVASAMTSGGILERRLKMIINNRSPLANRWTIGLMLLLATAVFPLGLVYAQDFDAVKKRLAESVKAGEITKAQAGFMLEALELSLKMKSEPRLTDRKPPEPIKLVGRKEQIEKLIDEIKEAAERGKISRRDAEAKINAVRKDLFQERRDLEKAEVQKSETRDRQRADQDLVERKERFEQIARELKFAVEKDRMSKEDAERKLDGARRELFGDLEKRERRDRQKTDDSEREEKYNQIYKDVERAVQQEKLSKRDAQKRLMDARRELFGERERADYAERKRDFADRDRAEVKKARDYADREREYADREREYKDRTDQRKAEEDEYRKRRLSDTFGADEREAQRDSDQTTRKRRFDSAAREIMNAVKEGKLSREDAERRLSEMKMIMYGQTDDSKANLRKRLTEMEARKARYEQVLEELERAIKSGKMSKEDAEKKAVELRKMMFGSTGKKTTDNARGANLKRIDQERALANAAKEMEEAVKSGKITKAEGLRVLEAYKRKLLSANEAKEKDSQDSAKKESRLPNRRLDESKSAKEKFDPFSQN